MKIVKVSKLEFPKTTNGITPSCTAWGILQTSQKRLSCTLDKNKQE
jgi:hypothetical protein